MKNQQSTIVFDRERASNHDQQFAKLAPMRHGLDMSICMAGLTHLNLVQKYCFD